MVQHCAVSFVVVCVFYVHLALMATRQQPLAKTKFACDKSSFYTLYEYKIIYSIRVICTFVQIV